MWLIPNVRNRNWNMTIAQHKNTQNSRRFINCGNAAGLTTTCQHTFHFVEENCVFTIAARWTWNNERADTSSGPTMKQACCQMLRTSGEVWHFEENRAESVRAALHCSHLSFPPQSGMLPFGYKTSGEEEEEGWKTCRSLIFCSPNIASRCLNPQTRCPCSATDPQNPHRYKNQLYLSDSAATGSRKRESKSTTSQCWSSCGR